MSANNLHPMFDASVLLDDEALEEVEKAISDEEFDDIPNLDGKFYISNSFVQFVRSANDFRDFRKSAPVQYYYDSEHIPPVDHILRFITNDKIATYSFDNDKTSDVDFTREQLRKEIDDSFYGHYVTHSAYDALIDILLDQLGYLFTSSLLLAAKDTIQKTINRVNGAITTVGDKLQEPVVRAAVEAQNAYWEYGDTLEQGLKLSAIKLGIATFVLGNVELVNVQNEVASVGYEILRAIADNSISERIVVSVDP